MLYKQYLVHHGVKGQRWGVKNGPPYPLKRVNSKTSVKEQNEIYSTLSEDDKKKIMGIDKSSKEKAPRTFTDEEQMASEDYIRSFVARYKNVPISTFGVWNEGDGTVALSLMTRGDGDYRGKGFAGAAVKRGMQWVDNNPEILTAYWCVRKDNAPSIALAKKVGFDYKRQDGEEWAVYWKRYKR